MNEHPSNPSTNQLRAGLDEAKLLEAVRWSGYPLQSLIAQELTSHFQVFEEWGYSDRATREHRSLDIYAFRELALPSGAPPARLHLLIECKRSEMPYVFFPPGAPRIPHDFPEIVGFGHLSLDLGNRTTQDASPASFFCAPELPFVSTEARVAVAYARAERKGSSAELSGEVPFKHVVLPLASAVQHLRDVFGGSHGTPLIVVSLCVLDAPMVMATGSPDSPQLMLDPWVRVVHQESERTGTHWRQQHYTVDFVHRSYLTIYLTQHLLPFAEELARRFQEGRHKFAKSVPARAKHLSWAQFIGR